MASQETSEDDVLDLSGQGLKKLSKPTLSQARVSKLILDNNDLNRLDCIDSFTALKNLSAAHNGLLRMYNVARLHHLVSLNLSHNGILTIEGLKEATQLRHLCLAGNNIKTIEHLNTNVLLDYIDLSDNNVSYITDLSFLVNLKTLLLNSNKIGHLQMCDKFLPSSLDTLSLAANNITDLNQVSYLVNLKDLRQLSIANNPCVAMTGNNVGFDYRPFLINWCMSLKVIDGFMVNEIESLKAEWLYSQGRGRQFRPGDHESLVAYLANTCPLGGESLESEEDRKLRLILSKAQQHQQQLKAQQTDGTLQRSSSVSPFTRRRTSNSLSRSNLNRGRRRTYTPDRMTTSFHSELPNSVNDAPSLMTQSLDLSLFNSNDSEDMRRKVPSQLVPQDEDSPLHSATEMVPVPESLLSPEYRPVEMIPSGTPAQTPATPATPATPSHPLAKKGIAQPLVPSLPRPSSAGRQSRLPVRGTSTSSGLTGCSGSVPPVAGGCLDDSSTSQQTEAVSLGTPYEQPELPIMELKMKPPQEPCKPVPAEDSREVRTASTTPTPAKRYENTERNDIPIKKPIQTDQPTPAARSAHVSQQANGTQKPHEPRRPTSLDLPLQIHHPMPNGWARFGPEISSAESQKCAATSIQRVWRGYYTRNLDPQISKVSRSLQDKRTLEHIRKLTEDLETTKSSLESERRLQLLQMQAITALWKKVVSLQQGGNIQTAVPPQNFPSGTHSSAGDLISGEPVGSVNSAESIRKLTHSCLHLHTQVAELQQSMQEVMGVLGLASRQGSIPRVASSTQTELSAVHTPTGVNHFPFQKVSHLVNTASEQLAKSSSGTSDCTITERAAHRPSSLQLNAAHPASLRHTPPQLNHFASTLVDGVLRTVSSEQGSVGNTPEDSSKADSNVDSSKDD